MEYRHREIGAGLLVVTALALLLAMVGLSSNVKDIFRAKKEVRVMFERVEGIERSSPVKQVGRLVGKVTEINVSPEDGNKIILTLRVFKDTVVKRNSAVSIKSPLVGEKFLDIGLGTPSSPPLMEGDVLPGKTGVNLDELSEKFVVVVNNIEKITEEMSDMVSGPTFKKNINRTLSNLTEITNNTNDLITSSRSDINRVFDTLQQVSNDLNKATRQLNSLIGDVKQIVASNRGNIDRTIENLRDTPDRLMGEVSQVRESVTAPIDENREEIDVILANIQTLTADLNKLTADIASVVDNADKITVNVEEASRNLDKITQNVEKVTQNLAELTEELKEKPYRIIRK